MPELDLPLPAERSELELPPGNSVTPPPTETPVAISDVAEDQGNNQGILLPLILIILAVYFFGPTSWRSFLRTAKDNILEEVKITASRLQTPKTVVPVTPETLVPEAPPSATQATPSGALTTPSGTLSVPTVTLSVTPALDSPLLTE